MAMCWCYVAPPILLIPFAIGDMCENATECTMTPGSVIEEFYLVEDDGYKAEMALTISTAGDLLGSTLISYLSDIKGRRPILLFCLMSFGVFNLMLAFSPNIYVFWILRLLQGAFSSGLNCANWVLAYESSSMGLRAYAPLVFGITWIIGYVAVAPLCYYVTYWRHQILITSFPSIIATLIYFFTIPESFHFTISNGLTDTVTSWYRNMNRYCECKRELTEVAEIIEKHKVVKDARNSNGKKELGLAKTLMTNKRVFLYIVIFAYIWASDFFIYAGLNILSTSLAGNKYWNFALGGIAEIPSYLISPYLLEKQGRRGFGAWTHLMTFAAFLATVFIKNPTISFVFWLIGKFSISCAFTAVFVYVSEVFPTVYRSGVLGICMFVSCFGGIAAGTVRSMNAISPDIPNIIFAVTSLLGAILTLFLPETKGKELPDTTEEMELFFSKKN
ncbi:unnamed protein product [Bursaphelenchus okinawaensis]|uniref:Major facilitator superfamily (MFS) profile domain-containing protein n=1 Tax=Bursaphelenchus okinawaensis TaxID=465554 RepID=A0A811L540_9BILA|nr:unnamed protein product [Bursaphelenchus okinawaensis]CAG9117658.1 unnamed protein product [Bursaphelenchus okinawaensis]